MTMVKVAKKKKQRIPMPGMVKVKSLKDAIRHTSDTLAEIHVNILKKGVK